MRKTTIMGKLLTDFRLKRNEARRKAEENLWKRNKLSHENPKHRAKLRVGYEIHEESVNKPDGTQLIVLSLWKKVDSLAVKVSVDTTAEEIKTEKGESIEDLMK